MALSKAFGLIVPYGYTECAANTRVDPLDPRGPIFCHKQAYVIKERDPRVVGNGGPTDGMYERIAFHALKWPQHTQFVDVVCPEHYIGHVMMQVNHSKVEWPAMSLFYHPLRMNAAEWYFGTVRRVPIDSVRFE